MPYATDCALASIASVADNMAVELIMTRSYFKCTQITSAELSSSRHIPAAAAAAASVVVTSLTSQLTPSFSRYRRAALRSKRRRICDERAYSNEFHGDSATWCTARAPHRAGPHRAGRSVTAWWSFIARQTAAFRAKYHRLP